MHKDIKIDVMSWNHFNDLRDAIFIKMFNIHQAGNFDFYLKLLNDTVSPSTINSATYVTERFINSFTESVIEYFRNGYGIKLDLPHGTFILDYEGDEKYIRFKFNNHAHDFLNGHSDIFEEFDYEDFDSNFVEIYEDLLSKGDLKIMLDRHGEYQLSDISVIILNDISRVIIGCCQIIGVSAHIKDHGTYYVNDSNDGRYLEFNSANNFKL